MLSPVCWQHDRIRIIDQRRLPDEEVWRELSSVDDVAEAIRTLAVRGAPAIGITAAMGCALAARLFPGDDPVALDQAVRRTADYLVKTRPTAVNLFWAAERMCRRLDTLRGLGADAIREALATEACAIHEEDIRACRAIGHRGAALLPARASVLTHCNAGALATGGFGTALGVIRAAVDSGKQIRVFVDETRPLLQGARLTTWELMRDGIDVTLICDNMAGYLMQLGKVDACIVGADRIAANGDSANKIGTYSVAVLARHHNIPFLVAAPFSSVDLSLASGSQIPIEERDPSEVSRFHGKLLAPDGTPVFNPAFDVTPAALIRAIVTERGVAFAPRLAEELQALGRIEPGQTHPDQAEQENP